jgi:electron transfer flavoprotein alpha subunit
LIISKVKRSLLRGGARSCKKFWHGNLRWFLVQSVDEVVKAALEYGADEVLLADDSALLDYRAETYASTLSALASSLSPDLILLPTTTRTRELAAMSAVDLNSNVITDATAVELSGENIIVTRPIYEAKLFEKVTASGKPQLITLRGRAFPKPEQQEGTASAAGTITKVDAKTDALSTVEGYSVAEVGVSLNDAGHHCFRWSRRIE